MVNALTQLIYMSLHRPSIPDVNTLGDWSQFRQVGSRNPFSITMVITDLYLWPWEQTSQVWATIMMLFLFCLFTFHKPLRRTSHKVKPCSEWMFQKQFTRSSVSGSLRCSARIEKELGQTMWNRPTIVLLAFKDLFMVCTKLSAWRLDEGW